MTTVITVSIHALGLIGSESTRTKVGQLLVASACHFAGLGLSHGVKNLDTKILVAKEKFYCQAANHVELVQSFK